MNFTDAHCHVDFPKDNTVAQRFVCAAKTGDWEAISKLPETDIPFYGIHPWYIEADTDLQKTGAALREILKEHPEAGVGEIGLDRLRDKNISAVSREALALQLSLAKEFRRPVVLHGTKCWGEVVKACEPFSDGIPSFLFHGFSRSAGLIPDIKKLNGFISVTAAVLNDHAVNYRNLVKELPIESLLIETDGEASKAADIPPVSAVYEKVAELRGVSLEELSAQININAENFIRFQ